MVDNPDGEGKLPEYRLNGLKEDIEKGEIALPNVQRGFVWKPWQIENLWDSLMRRFPVGSFVGVEKDGKTELLDGQQRATAIALAFFEPDGTKKTRMERKKTRRTCYGLRRIWCGCSLI